tara:strand:- start:670 stop:846 length:177 start_codon:yes stop_codon:yes gene_type:complete
MKIGDLVRGWYSDFDGEQIGIVIDVINSDYQVPPVCKVLWPTGEIEKEWTDDVEVVTK